MPNATYSLSRSLRTAFALSASRLSCCALPRQTPSASLMRPCLRYILSGTSVRPFASLFSRSSSTSLAWTSSLRRLFGSWLKRLPKAYAAMSAPSSHSSPPAQPPVAAQQRAELPASRSWREPSRRHAGQHNLGIAEHAHVRLGRREVDATPLERRLAVAHPRRPLHPAALRVAVIILKTHRDV